MILQQQVFYVFRAGIPSQQHLAPDTAAFILSGIAPDVMLTQHNNMLHSFHLESRGLVPRPMGGRQTRAGDGPSAGKPLAGGLAPLPEVLDVKLS